MLTYGLFEQHHVWQIRVHCSEKFCACLWDGNVLCQKVACMRHEGVHDPVFGIFLDHVLSIGKSSSWNPDRPYTSPRRSTSVVFERSSADSRADRRKETSRTIMHRGGHATTGIVSGTWRCGTAAEDKESARLGFQTW
jgi:hypothetical protein